MALSPAIALTSPGRPNTKATSAKSKAQLVPNSTASQDTSSGSRSTQDLAEKLNEETRNNYVKVKKLGEGTYAVVWLAHKRSDPKSLVAIKKIKVNAEYRDGISMDALREIKFLQELSHPNIIALESVFSSKNGNLNLALEYVPLGDLEMLIKDKDGVRYGLADMKAWMGMLGRAVWWCHENFILHRDIKPNNLLIAADGELKLADFGLARSFADPYGKMTHQVITRWYRPPELLFGARYYSGAVDIWSVGMVFAELINRTPYVPGSSDLDQLDRICQAVGTPTEENWPGVTKLPGYVSHGGLDGAPYPVRGRDFYSDMFGTVGSVGVELLMFMLVLDPRKRITARGVLSHRWWSTDPPPAKKEDLPKKAGGDAKIGEDLKRRAGDLGDERGTKVARILDFSK